MKRCPRCNRDLSLRDFRKNCKRKDGLDGWCKKCRTETVNHIKAKERKKRFYATRKAEYWKRYRQEHWIKIRAREIANYRYKERFPCMVVGCEEIGERHHHDYGNPLDIIWLCKKHHSELSQS